MWFTFLAATLLMESGCGSVGPDAELQRRVTSLIAELQSQETRRAARDALIAIGRPATALMRKRMLDPSFTVRWEMVNIQGYVLDESAIESLVERVLHDDDSHIRWRSLWALSSYPAGSRAAAIALLRQAMKTGVEREHWNAAVGLSMLADRECLPVIHAGLTQADDWRRWEAINALRRISDDTSASELGRLIEAGSERDRREAVMSLGAIGGDDAVALLLAALRDADPGVRWRAVMSLSQLRATVGPTLRALRTTEANPEVLTQIEKALAGLAHEQP